MGGRACIVLRDSRVSDHIHSNIQLVKLVCGCLERVYHRVVIL